MPHAASLTVVLALAAVTSTPDLSTNPAVRAACKDDAIRLCKDAVHDDAKLHACMREHVSQLSKPCLEALRKQPAGHAVGMSAPFTPRQNE